jgi:ribonuclease P protein component
MTTATLPRSARLLKSRDFKRVYGRGRRLTGQQVVVVAVPRRDPGVRLGVSVSKDHGSAVRRNKVKRILREAFRLERARMQGDLDVVLIPKTPGVKLHLASLQREVRELIDRLARGDGRSRQPKGRT